MSDERQRVTAAEVFQRLRVPAHGSKELRALVWHPAQRDVITAFDLLDATGRPVYSELGIFWLKKAGKSTTAAGLALAELLGASAESDREVIVVASDLAQSRDVVFASCVRFVRRDPWLAKRIKVMRTELIFRETVTSARTGGRHVEEHVLRAVPARDAKSLHGTNATLTVIDETWALADYALLEALAPSAARRGPRFIYSSYAGLRSQQREGVPLWDIWQRWKRGDLFVSYLGGPDGWRAVPWISQRLIDGERRRLAAVPSKFLRLWQNLWSAGDESAFLTADEIAAAVDATLTEPASGEPGQAYSLGVDLGLSNDWAAVVITHVNADAKIVVDVVRWWVGTKQRNVSLSAVEEEIVALARRFKLAKCVLDQWQGQLLAERLRVRHVPGVRVVTMETARLDAHATLLKSLFAGRHIRVPAIPELVEQLESIVGAETRRDRMRFTSGTGRGAGQHDDLIVALTLSAEAHGATVGRPTLPATFRSCFREASGLSANCFLIGGSGLPIAGDACCTACPGRQFAESAYQAHVARVADGLDIRTWYPLHVQPNTFISMRRADRWAAFNV